MNVRVLSEKVFTKELSVWCVFYSFNKTAGESADLLRFLRFGRPCIVV